MTANSTMPTLEFWFDFASTYSYLSAMRIEQAAAAANVGVVYRPFLLGPIFKAQGWATSPFNIYPAKGRYMIRDIERLATLRGLPFRMPNSFPASSLKAARIALIGEDEGFLVPFTSAVFAYQFGHGGDIADDTALTHIIDDLGLDSARLFAASSSQDIKQKLRARTADADRIGIFGAPAFVTPDGELFWGDDRLEQALRWAAHL